MIKCRFCDAPVTGRGLCKSHYYKMRRRGLLEGFHTKEQPLRDRLMAKVIMSENGCWLWSGLRNSYGYAMLWREGKAVRAHRVAYEIFKGPVADDLVVCHTCDAPECVNPDHLFIGTRKDNNADSARKLRNSYGERNGHARITTVQAVEIYHSTLPQRALAKKYGIHQSTVSDIKTGRRWKYLPVEGPPGKSSRHLVNPE